MIRKFIDKQVSIMNSLEEKSDTNQILDNTTTTESNSKLNAYGKINILNSQHVLTKNTTIICDPSNIIRSLPNISRSNEEIDQTSDENGPLNIITRQQWMAQLPRDIATLQNTAKFVVISHTATEEGFTDPENTLLVKLIQSFHMECLKWSDIAYNFLIGNNGNVYEGRGWNVIGAHTYGYNYISVGISFIGCYMNHLPTKEALNSAKALISYGVSEKYIIPEYSLVGHCQCSPVESPGYQLYMEIKKWPKWRELNSTDTII